MATATGRDAKAAPAMPRAFIAGSRKNDRDGGFDQTIVQTTAEQALRTYQIPPTGYLRAVWILVENTAVNTSTATVAYNENGPFNVLSGVRLLDTNSRPIIGTLSGYDIYILNKYGGYMFQGDAKAAAVYSATSGAGTTAGTFAFTLCLPLEIVQRNALGSQLNKSAAATFAIEWRVAASGTVFSTAPTNSSTIRVRAALASWLDPQPADALGNPVLQDPPQLNTTQYWLKQTYDDVLTRARLQGIDGLVRMLIFIAYRSASTRANGEADWPDPFSLKYEESFLIQSRIRLLWRQWIAQHYGYAAAAEASTGRDNGVYPVWEFMQDFQAKPGGELTRGYLPMSSASNLEIEGTFANADDLDLLVNTVVPFPQGAIKEMAVI